MSYEFLENRRPDGEDKKARSRNAVLDYMTEKLDRYLSNTPSREQLLAAAWTYRDCWGPPHWRGHSIKISVYARVIHIHCQGNQIHRAHLIHKLLEEDDPHFPNDKKKRTAKLAYQQDDFNARRVGKLVDAAGTGDAALNRAQVEREMKFSTKNTIDRLLEAKAQMNDRHEAVIFNASMKNSKFRYPFTNGSRVSAEDILGRVKAVVNTAQTGAIEGAPGLAI